MDTSKHTSLKLKTFRQAQTAFSLIEVTLAIGIVGFAFTTILGLLPAGLSNFRKAMDTEVEAQIVQQVTNEAMQADFDQLIKSPVPTVDDLANQITIAGPRRRCTLRRMWFARRRLHRSDTRPAGSVRTPHPDL